MTDPASFRVADAARVRALIDDLAARALAALPDRFTVVGVRRRGVPLAEALVERWESRSGGDFALGEIALKRYADDLSILHERPKLLDKSLPDVEGATVLLVDDVLYSGRTLFHAVELLVSAGAERVACAVLCSRGPNDVPVHADLVALQLDVGPGNLIEVHAPPYDDEWGVVLEVSR